MHINDTFLFHKGESFDGKVTSICGIEYPSTKTNSRTKQPLPLNVRPGGFLPEPCLMLSLRTGRFAEHMHTRTTCRTLFSMSRSVLSDCAVFALTPVFCLSMYDKEVFTRALSYTVFKIGRFAEHINTPSGIHSVNFLSGIIFISLLQCNDQYCIMCYWVA